MRIGIDLGGTKIEVIALDDDGAILLRHRVLTPQGDYAGTVRAVADLVAVAEARTGQRGTVGVATPGALSRATGMLKNSNSTVLNGRALDRDLAAAIGRPIRMENDANCLALSEAVDGAAAGRYVVFAAILGTGVGGGLAVGRQVTAGRNRIAGEWGHTQLPWMRDDERPGARCHCGKAGCVETYLSGAGMRRDHRAATGRDLCAEDIVAGALGGEPRAGATVARYRDRLGRALAGIVNIVDPDVIVLGGGLSNIAPIYEGLPALVERWAFSDELDTPIAPAAHGDSSGVRGAARLWPENMEGATVPR